MKKAARIVCYSLLILAISGASRPSTNGPGEANQITLLTLNQPPCSVPSGESVIKAKLAYNIADAEQSEHGFAVSIKFQGVDPRMTFSVGEVGETAVTHRSDTLMLEYPMDAIVRNPRLRRPITCYFYLHRNTGERRSTVIAKTDPIIFRECQ